MQAISYITWQDVRANIKQVNKKLYDIIEDLNPGPRLKLIVANYRYGESIIKNGELVLPHSDNSNKQTNQLIAKLKSDLAYSTIPLSVPINKACEAFVQSRKNHIMPLRFLEPGDMFGLFEVVNSLLNIQRKPIWNITAGARSLIMLPKLAETNKHEKINLHHGVDTSAPRKLQQQWSVFAEIANSKITASPWSCQIVFFTHSWMDNYGKPNDWRWNKFYNYLHEMSWLQAQHTQTDVMFNLLWQLFSITLGDRNLNPRPYLIDTIKHILAIPTGTAPGFCFNNSEIIAPIKTIAATYSDIYDLKYAPSFMHAYNLMPGKDSKELFYSLAYPIVVEGYPDHKQLPSNKQDLQQIISIMNLFLDNIEKQQLDFQAPFPVAINKSTYSYYHASYDAKRDIKDPHSIIDTDKLTKQVILNGSDKEFCHNSSFLKGCIKIAEK